MPPALIGVGRHQSQKWSRPPAGLKVDHTQPISFAMSAKGAGLACPRSLRRTFRLNYNISLQVKKQNPWVQLT